MKVIGLTGASGAGKGELGKIMSEKYGAVYVDTDLIARKVVKKGSPCLAELKNAFGSEIIAKCGRLNRKKLADIAFSDEKKHKELNKITHFYINSEVKKIIEKAKKRDEKYCVIDAPLLFESGENKLCDVTLGVIADRKTRTERIVKRDKISETSAEKRINAGRDDAFFVKNCDYVFENNGTDYSEMQKNAQIFLDKMFSEITD